MSLVYRDDNNRSAPRSSLQTIRSYVHEEFGIYFPPGKLYSLEAKIRKRARSLGLPSMEEYAEFLSQTQEEVPRFLDVVSTNKTHFFREPKHWQYMKDVLIPRWQKQSQVRVWSAACSSGEEPYTVAMLLEDAVSGDHTPPSSFQYRILATDISPSVLQKGQRGQYDSRDLEAVREFRPGYVVRFYESVGKEQYQVKEQLRQKVTFRQFNLKKPFPVRRSFDLVLCRNVLIYFDQKMIEELIRKFETVLAPGGHLFIGHTETLNSISTQLERVQPAVYRLPSS